MALSFEFPIEYGQVIEFLRATGVEPAQSEGSLMVPPTFCAVADPFDPDFARRPYPGRPWPNSDQIPMAGDTGGGDAPLHVSQRFEYARPTVIGETLSAHREPPREWTKTGRRGGELRFVELVTKFHDASGAIVVSSSWLDVYPERTHRDLSSSGASRESFEPPVDSATIQLVESLTRTQIIMYIAAVGDFHPLHHDEPFAIHHGYPSIFAPGMLTMALAARALTTHRPADQLMSLDGRFHKQVWPGDAITAFLHDRTRTTASVALVNGDAQLLFSASATWT